MTVKCGGVDTGDTITIKGCSVELECVGHTGGSLLDVEDVCVNSQSTYQKTKWKVNVEPSGTDATVTLTSGAMVNVTAISGSLSAMSDGDEFWVEANGYGGHGDYTLSVSHNEVSGCTDSGGGSVSPCYIKTYV